MVFKINDRVIGPDQPPYIIAELSANHNGSLERALKTIDEAKRCGADAIKLQTYLPETLTLDVKKEDFLVTDRESLWSGRYLNVSLMRDDHHEQRQVSHCDDHVLASVLNVA